MTTTALLAAPDPTRATDIAQRLRLQQDLLVTTSTIIALLGLLWGLVYLYIGSVTAGSIPIIYAAISFVSIGYYSLTGRYHLFRFTQLLLILIFPGMLTWVLGGFINSSGVILWSINSPVGALLYDSRRKAVIWFAMFVSLIVLTAIVDAGLIGPIFPPHHTLPPGILTTIFAMNLIGPSVVVFLLLIYFTQQRDHTHELLVTEQGKSSSLLLNIFPQPIVRRLMDGQQYVADCISDASILFADIAGFTPLSAKMEVEMVVEFLNDLHTAFDEIMERHGLEKIRTIGYGYMAASGVPTARPDHARAIADAALDMMDYADSLQVSGDFPLLLRIGINSGQVMAGVIGRKKFSYDIWGDPVNVASRMESQGLAGCIQVSARTYELLKDDFVLEPRGRIDIKGKGEMDTWILVGRKRPD